jgi:hypothetical protein
MLRFSASRPGRVMSCVIFFYRTATRFLGLKVTPTASPRTLGADRVEVMVRMVNRAKWKPGSGLASNEIPADAITRDFKTESNKLSFWRCEDTSKVGLERAVLALASGRDRPDKLEAVWIDAEQARAAGVNFEPSPDDGNTPVADLAKWHYNAVGLDRHRHGALADLIRGAIDEDRSQLWTKLDVTRLLADAAASGLLSSKSLEPKLGAAVEAELKRRGGI